MGSTSQVEHRRHGNPASSAPQQNKEAGAGVSPDALSERQPTASAAERLTG